MTTDRDAIESLAGRMAGQLGRPMAKTQEAAELLGLSESSFRALVYRGEVKGSRLAANGPLRFRVDELARYVVEAEKRSLPALAEDDTEERRARGRRRRKSSAEAARA